MSVVPSVQRSGTEARPIRVLVIAPYVPLASMRHAAGVVTHHMLRGLARTCEVSCICWGTATERKQLESDPIREIVRVVLPRRMGFARSVLLGILCLIREPVATTLLLAESILAYVRRDPYFGHLTILQALSVVEANRLVASERFDVVQVDHSALITIGRFVRHPTKVLCFHDVFQTIIDRLEIPPRARRSAVQIERRGCRYYRSFVTLSQKDTAFVARTTGKPALRFMPYVDAPPYKPERKVSPYSMLFFGALDRRVNQEAARFLVREVLPLLRRSVPSAALTIAGANPPEDLQRVAAADPEHLRVTGFVPNVAPLFAAAHVFVCPLFVGGGLIIKVLTAMGHGVPVVANQIAVEGTEAEDGVHYLRAESGADFAAQIQRIFCNDELASALGEKGRSYFEQHCDWRASVTELCRVYRDFTAGGALVRVEGT